MKKKDFFLQQNHHGTLTESQGQSRTSTDEHDSTMITLRFRPCLQATMVHPRNFKQFKTSVVTPGTPGFFRDHHGPRRMYLRCYYECVTGALVFGQ